MYVEVHGPLILFGNVARGDPSRRKVLISVRMLVFLIGNTSWVYALLMRGHSIVMLMLMFLS
jgi:hypothetical protein